jgi:hypothetical protein
MASPTWMPEGATGKPNDTRLRTLQKILGSLNDGGGGGGGGVGAVYSGHYAGGAPTQTPTASAALAFDLDDPFTLWHWDGSNWT